MVFQNKNLIAGFSDSPKNSRDDDLLNISSYYKGLACYIQGCRTPMTIAIQGEWGSGKTSLISFIGEELESVESGRYKIINLNTWQYSQFDLGERLVFSLIEEIVHELAPKVDSEKRIKKILYNLSMFTLGIGANYLGINKEFEGLINGFEGESSGGPVQAIKDLRKEFSSIVQDSCAKNGFSKVVIFIDDLDRLEPSRAIELLECLKLFVESEGCVFVLAIDFDVVLQGVSKKYGWIETDDLSKAKSYFDKFIQLPFHVPVGFYKTERFIESRINEISSQLVGQPVQIDRYYDAVRYSVGNNPRAINRLLNSYSLSLNILLVKQDSNDLEGFDGRTPANLLLLFVLLCLQVSYEEFYSNFIQLGEDKTGEKIRNLINNFEDLSGGPENSGDYSAAGDESDADFSWISDISEYNKKNIALLLSIISDIVESDDISSESSTSRTTDDLYKDLFRMIDFTEVTAVQEKPQKDKMSALSARFNNITDKNERLEKLKQDTANKPENYRLVTHLEDILVSRINSSDFSIGAQKYQSWTLYARGRKFADIQFKRLISANFGGTSREAKRQGVFYSEEWSGLVSRLESTYCLMKKNDQIHLGDPMSYKIRDNTNPIRITGVSSKADIEKLAEIILEAYKIFTESKIK